MLSYFGAGEDSWGSLGQQGDETINPKGMGLRQRRGDRASWLLVGVGVGAAKGYPPQRNISTAVWGQTSPGAIFLLGLRNPQGEDKGAGLSQDNPPIRESEAGTPLSSRRTRLWGLGACSPPQGAMGSRLLPWVMLYFLRAGKSCGQRDNCPSELVDSRKLYLTLGVIINLSGAYLISVVPTGPLEAEVTQTPRHLIKTTGQTATLRCSPISGHSSVSWYQQAQSQGPQFIYEFYETLQRAKGNFSNRFLAKQFPDFSSELNVNSLDLTDSALYLCASSLAQLCWVTRALHTNLSALVWAVTEQCSLPPRFPSSEGCF